MTNKQTGTSGLVEVTQADRDAAAEIYRRLTDCSAHWPHEIRMGIRDDDHLVQALARHRLASLSPVPDEVERRELYIEFDGDTPVAAVYRENRREVMRCTIRLTASRPSDDGEVERPNRQLLRLVAYVTGLPDDLRWTPEFTRYVNGEFNEIAAALSSLVGEK